MPENISQQILLQETNSGKDLTYDVLKKNVLTYLAAVPGGSMPMINNMERNSGPSSDEADWDNPADGAWKEANGAEWPEVPEWYEGQQNMGDAAAMYNNGKGKNGKGKGKGFQGNFHVCGEWGHSQRFCPKGGGKGKGGKMNKGKGKGKGMFGGGKAKGKGKGACHACGEQGHFAR